MKYLRILIDPIKVKGDPEDPETLTADVYEKVQAMIEAETLSYSIDEDEDSEDDDY